MRAEQEPPALAALVDMMADVFGIDLSERNLSDLDEFFAMFSVRTVRDGDDIVQLEFEDRYLLELDEVFFTLGPYVERGSWVLFHSGTGERWRYVYDGRVERRTEPIKPWYGS